MNVPIKISFRQVEKTEDILNLINEKTEKLEQACNYLSSVRVAVDRKQRFKKSGSPYRVRIDMTVPPGHELIVKRDPTEGDLHDSLDQIIRDTFEAARRRLNKLVERQRGEVKAKANPAIDGPFY